MAKKCYNLKKVTALTKHNKTFYYVDNKRVSKKEYDRLNWIGVNSCLQTVIIGDKVQQIKTVIVTNAE